MTVLANQPGESDQTRRFAAKVILDDLTSDRLTTAYRYAALAFVRRIAGNSGDATSKGYIVALLERNMNLSNAPDHWASLQRTIDTIAATAGGRDNLDVPVLSSSEKRAGRLEARAIPKPAADEEYVPPPTEDRARGAKGVSGAGITNVGSWSERAVAQLKRWKYELLEGIDAADAILGAAFVGYAVFSALKMVHLGAPLLALFVALPAYAYMMTKGFFHRHPWSAWFQLIVISCFFETAATATLSLSTLVIGGIGTAALIAVAAAALKSPEDDPQWFGFLANVVLAILFGSAV
jgi:hypothetical protein